MHHRESLASAERVVGRVKDLSLVSRGFHRRQLHAALVLERPWRKQPLADDIVEAGLVQIEQQRAAASKAVWSGSARKVWVSSMTSVDFGNPSGPLTAGRRAPNEPRSGESRHCTSWPPTVPVQDFAGSSSPRIWRSRRRSGCLWFDKPSLSMPAFFARAETLSPDQSPDPSSDRAPEGPSENSSASFGSIGGGSHSRESSASRLMS